MAREGISALVKCTKQFVPIVARNAKFLSNPQKEGLFTAENALLNTENISSWINM